MNSNVNREKKYSKEEFESRKALRIAARDRMIALNDPRVIEWIIALEDKVHKRSTLRSHRGD